jgi:hypothetical protein
VERSPLSRAELPALHVAAGFSNWRAVTSAGKQFGAQVLSAKAGEATERSIIAGVQPGAIALLLYFHVLK